MFFDFNSVSCFWVCELLCFFRNEAVLTGGEVSEQCIYQQFIMWR